MSEHVKTVQAIFDCMGRGDIPGLLDYLAPDVCWEPTGG
jgi:ketosteroid isomerase-like protein